MEILTELLPNELMEALGRKNTFNIADKNDFFWKFINAYVSVICDYLYHGRRQKSESCSAFISKCETNTKGQIKSVIFHLFTEALRFEGCQLHELESKLKAAYKKEISQDSIELNDNVHQAIKRIMRNNNRGFPEGLAVEVRLVYWMAMLISQADKCNLINLLSPYPTAKNTDEDDDLDRRHRDDITFYKEVSRENNWTRGNINPGYKPYPYFSDEVGQKLAAAFRQASSEYRDLFNIAITSKCAVRFLSHLPNVSRDFKLEHVVKKDETSFWNYIQNRRNNIGEFCSARNHPLPEFNTVTAPKGLNSRSIFGEDFSNIFNTIQDDLELKDAMIGSLKIATDFGKKRLFLYLYRCQDSPVREIYLSIYSAANAA